MISGLRARSRIDGLMTLAMLFLVKVDDGAALASPVMGELDDLGTPPTFHS